MGDATTEQGKMTEANTKSQFCQCSMVRETDQLCTAEFALKDNKPLLQVNAFASCYSPIWLAELKKPFMKENQELTRV